MAFLIKLVDRLPRLGLPARIAALGGVLLAALAIALPFALWRGGPGELLAATAAAGVCLASGAGALAVCKLFDKPEMALLGVVGGMLLRMAVPFAALGIIYSQRGGVTQFGLVYYMLGFYLISLAVETLLVLPAQVGEPSA